MSERKICEKQERVSKVVDYDTGNPIWKKKIWVELDPQPCCKNCIQRIDENDYGNLIMCGQFHTWLKLDFYCSYWVLRE